MDNGAIFPPKIGRRKIAGPAAKIQSGARLYISPYLAFQWKLYGGPCPSPIWSSGPPLQPSKKAPPVLAAKIASPKTKARQSLSLPSSHPSEHHTNGLGYVCIGPVLTSSQTSHQSHLNFVVADFTPSRKAKTQATRCRSPPRCVASFWHCVAFPCFASLTLAASLLLPLSVLAHGRRAHGLCVHAAFRSIRSAPDAIALLEEDTAKTTALLSVKTSGTRP